MTGLDTPTLSCYTDPQMPARAFDTELHPVSHGPVLHTKGGVVLYPHGKRFPNLCKICTGCP